MNWIGTKNLGMLLLAIWLIASGALTFMHTTSINAAPLLAALAIAAGICIVLGR